MENTPRRDWDGAEVIGQDVCAWGPEAAYDIRAPPNKKSQMA